MSSYELAFWNDCTNTWDEEQKHYVYARLMGIDFDLKGKDVIDIGGGPVSMLLKCRNRGDCCVVDPLVDRWPEWVRMRYQAADIGVWTERGENIRPLTPPLDYDEAWIYNVLQHTDNPELVVHNARQVATVVRLFEWVNIPAYDGHPHELKVEDLERWLGGKGTVTELAEQGCYGTAFSGVFS